MWPLPVEPRHFEGLWCEPCHSDRLKKYGTYLADNGSNWFLSGTSDPRFDDELRQLRVVPGTALEVVKTGTLYH